MKDILTALTAIVRPPVVFLSIIVAIVCSFFFVTKTVIIITLLFYALYGFLDYLNTERKSVLKEKSYPIKETSFIIPNNFTRPLDVVPFKVLEKFYYGGFTFSVLRINQGPTIGITHPLCPRCSGNLVEDARVWFPGYIRIRLRCNDCKKTYKSKFTKTELTQKVAEHHGVNLHQ